MSHGYWESLTRHQKRIILIWIYVLRNDSWEDVSNCAEGYFIDGHGIDTDTLPAFLFSIKKRSNELEIMEQGGGLKWI